MLKADASPSTVIFEEGPHGWSPVLEILSRLLDGSPKAASLLKIILKHDPSKSILTRRTSFANTTPLNFVLSFTSPDLASTKAFEAIWEEKDFWPETQMFSREFFRFLIDSGKGLMLTAIFDRFPENFVHHKDSFQTEIWPYTDMEPFWLTYGDLFHAIAIRDGKKLLEIISGESSITQEFRQIERHKENIAIYYENHALTALETAKWDWYLTNIRCLIESLQAIQEEMPRGFDLQWKFPGGRIFQSGLQTRVLLSSLEGLSRIPHRALVKKPLKAIALQKLAKLTVFSNHPSRHLLKQYSSLYQTIAGHYSADDVKENLTDYFEFLDLSVEDRLGAKTVEEFFETLNFHFEP
jgi:hypothetical protein